MEGVDSTTSFSKKEQMLLSALWEIEDYCNCYMEFAAVDDCMPFGWAIEIRDIAGGALKKATLDVDHEKKFQPTEWLKSYVPAK